MSRGNATQSDDFDVKICRIGSVCTITGRFTSLNNAPTDSIVAYIPWSLLETEGMVVNLTSNIYLNIVNLSDNVLRDDVELPIYVAARGDSDDIQIKTSKKADSSELFRFTLTFNLIC